MRNIIWRKPSGNEPAYVTSKASRSPASAPIRPTSAHGSLIGIRYAVPTGEIVGVNVAAEEITERRSSKLQINSLDPTFGFTKDQGATPAGVILR